jgi:hypothetical protein
MFEAVSGPALVMLNKYVNKLDTNTGSGDALKVNFTSAFALVTVVVTLMLLLSGFGSKTAPVTLIPVAKLPAPNGVTVVTTLEDKFEAILPKSQLTVFEAKLQGVPCPLLAETKVTLLGKVWVNFTAVALFGPALFTRLV